MISDPQTRRAQIAELLTALHDHLQVVGIDSAELALNPMATLSARGDVDVISVDPNSLPTHCSVAACYIATSSPPQILVSHDAAAARRAFSILHEYAHHLRDVVPAVADEFWSMPDGGKAIEEDLADAFAAAILIPEPVRLESFEHGVTAAAVVRLSHISSGSREACCVAAANQLPTPGYVMLLDSSGTARFTARQGNELPIRRGTRQAATILATAAHGGRARGVDTPTFASGVTGRQMHVDAVLDGQYIFAVWTTDSPPWGGLSVPLNDGPTGHDGYCEACDVEFTAWTTPCQECDEPHCSRCGACACQPGAKLLPSVRNRTCDRCFLTLPVAAFAGDSPTCKEH
jgi:hypothetical protein